MVLYRGEIEGGGDKILRYSIGVCVSGVNCQRGSPDKTSSYSASCTALLAHKSQKYYE